MSCDVSCHVTSPADKPLIVTFKKGKAVGDAAFSNTPKWPDLLQRAEGLFEELAIESFSLKAGKLELSEENWFAYAAGKSTVTLGVRRLSYLHAMFASLSLLHAKRFCWLLPGIFVTMPRPPFT